MTSYISSIRKQLNEEQSEEEPRMSDDSFLKRDLEKLKSLWRNVKENKGPGDTNMSYEGIHIPHGEYKEDNSAVVEDQPSEENVFDYRAKFREYENEIKNLREKLGFSESRLAKLQEYNTALNEKLNTAEQELKECYSKLSKQNYINQVRAIEIEDIHTKMSTISLSNQNEIEKLRENYEELKVSMIEKQYRIDQLEQLLKDKDEEIQDLNEKQPEYSEKQFENLLKENRLLREKINETEKDLDNLYLLRKSESAILLEVERQKADIQRLIHLLQSTEEFQEFAENANLSNYQIRFLKDGFKRKDSSKHLKLHSDLNKEKNNIESIYWVPLEAFRFAHDLRLKYKGQFTEEILELLLMELNKIWKSKEEKSIKTLKEKHNLEVKELKTQIRMRSNGSDIVQKKVVSRLKDQLQKNTKELNTFRKNKRTSELDILANTIKVTTEKHDKFRHLEHERKILQEKLQEAESSQHNTTEYKFHFIDGSLWMHETILTEVERLIHNLQKVIEEYENKLNQFESDDDHYKNKFLSNKKSWISTNIESIVNSFYESYQNLKSKVEIIKTSAFSA